MIHIKGLAFLDAIWDMAIEKGCQCKNDEKFSQNFLGAIHCEECHDNLFTQKEIEQMEERGELPTPHLTAKKLNNWY